MKKGLMGILCVLAFAFSVTAATQTIDVGSASDGLDSASFRWSVRNIAPSGCYGCQDATSPVKDGTYRTTWEPISGLCPWYAAPATFVINVPEGEKAKKLVIEALDGCSSEDSFYVAVDDGSGFKGVGYWADEPGIFTGSCDTSTEDWKEIAFDLGDETGNLTFIIIPYEETKPWTPWAYCSTYGQVAVQKISLESSEYGGQDGPVVPEFSSVAAGLALAGAGAGFVLLRKRR